jgi:hypothetical protein
VAADAQINPLKNLQYRSIGPFRGGVFKTTDGGEKDLEKFSFAATKPARSIYF